jgi:hypothetical protein
MKNVKAIFPTWELCLYINMVVFLQKSCLSYFLKFSNFKTNRRAQCHLYILPLTTKSKAQNIYKACSFQLVFIYSLGEMDFNLLKKFTPARGLI